ncbi:hypothetical protein AB0M48_41040 [Lentzea sp. NPDC051208]|uniref:hypothetical protein n=1 Tax=Lentzea sp. NPDC051208 TaxID=3154642 RepID=UPI00343E3E85
MPNWSGLGPDLELKPIYRISACLSPRASRLGPAGLVPAGVTRMQKTFADEVKDSLQWHPGKTAEVVVGLGDQVSVVCEAGSRAGLVRASPRLCNGSFDDEVQRAIAKAQVSCGGVVNILVVLGRDG